MSVSFDTAGFEKFLHDKIKVNGKTGKLAGVVSITREGHKISVKTEGDMSKRCVL